MKIKANLVLILMYLMPLLVEGKPIVHPLEQKTFGYYSVILPDDYLESESDRKQYSACILIQGSGGSEQSSLGLVDNFLGRDGVIYICPRAPFPKNSVYFKKDKPGFTAWPEYGYESSSSIKVLDENKIDDLSIETSYTRWIYDCLINAKKRYRIRDEKVVVLGHSQGAAFSLRFAIDYPEFVKACFASAGYYKSRLENEDSGKILKNNDIYIYFCHNEDDTAVNFENGKLLLEYLKKHEVKFDHTFYPSGKHKFINKEKDKAKLFIDKWCRGL